MARIELPQGHLTDYERAICYYTLPKVIHPVTFGLIVAYSVCLLEALALLIYGLVAQNILAAQIGRIAVFATVALGVLTFLLRSLFNEIRMRRMLAAARGVPDASNMAVDIPDPFAGHLLLQHPVWVKGDLFACTDNKGNLVFFVETDAHQPVYRVKDAQDNEVLRVEVLSGTPSFALSGMGPAKVAAFEGAREVARITRGFNFGPPTYSVECLNLGQKKFRVHQGSIYRDKELVGRLYPLRKSLYLDIRQEEFEKGILALFVTMT